MKPMNYKNGELGMWHHFAEVAEHIKFVSESQEFTLIGLCKYYSWDNEAFEEYCNCPIIDRKKDFDSKNECWKCNHYKTVSPKESEQP